ncbi:MAG: Flp pilus assembly protein CpaB [Vampirovibrionales bacterium]|nr:Flp pilus assembly protein CpaB [Vampirovibrionales bacterium]
MATVKRSRKAWIQFAVAVAVALVIGAVALFMVYGLVTGLIGQQTAIKSTYEKQTQDLKQQVEDLNKKLAEKAPEMAQQEVRVKSNIEVGQPITAELLEEVALPVGQAPQDGAITKIANAAGRLATMPLVAGSVLSESQLMGTDGMLPLAKGMRAVSLQITPASLIGGSVMIGSRVDVLATFPDEGVTRTLLQNVRVLLVDGDHAAKAGEDTSKKTARRFTTDHMTLEVSPKDAERLVLASRVGQVQMSLRAYDDKAKAAVRGSDTIQLVSGVSPSQSARSAQSLLLEAQRKAVKAVTPPLTLQILRGPQAESHAFETVVSP